MSRSAYFDKEAQDNLVNGLNLVANAVGSTLFPAPCWKNSSYC